MIRVRSGSYPRNRLCWRILTRKRTNHERGTNRESLCQAKLYQVTLM
jgi:hypothetical protein